MKSIKLVIGLCKQVTWICRPGEATPLAATSSFLGVDARQSKAIGYSAEIARFAKKKPHFQSMLSYYREFSKLEIFEFRYNSKHSKILILVTSNLKYLVMLNSMIALPF